MEVINIYYSDELYHHGILGMKWGVRRYQNEDGTLTPKGKARAMQVEASKHLQKSETRKARKTLNTHVVMDTKYAQSFRRASEIQRRKADHHMKGSDKYNKHMKKAEAYTKEAEEYVRKATKALDKIRDIDSGKLKAGRDFIVQTDLNISLTNFGAAWEYGKSARNGYNKSTHITGLGTMDRTIVFKNDKK